MTAQGWGVGCMLRRLQDLRRLLADWLQGVWLHCTAPHAAALRSCCPAAPAADLAVLPGPLPVHWCTRSSHPHKLLLSHLACAQIWQCSQDHSNNLVHEFFESHHFAAGIEAIPGVWRAWGVGRRCLRASVWWSGQLWLACMQVAPLCGGHRGHPRCQGDRRPAGLQASLTVLLPLDRPPLCHRLLLCGC